MKNTKFFYPHLERLRKHPSIFKYLTYEGGLRMLKYHNLQFTRADQLNDNEDCHISKINFDRLKKTNIDFTANIAEQAKIINSWGICSLGTTHDNSTLWKRYTKTNELYNGFCIELDLDKTIKCLINNLKCAAFVVNYKESTKESIPHELLLGTETEKYTYFILLLTTKNTTKWSKEKEVRIITPERLENKNLRITLDIGCFKNIYLGKDITDKQYEEVLKITKHLKYSGNLTKI